MTEQEARTKYCPFFISGFYAGAAGKGDANTNCAGSDCMMWKWENYSSSSDPRAVSDTEGHCGLVK